MVLPAYRIYSDGACVAEPQPIDRTGGEILDKDIRALCHLLHQLQAGSDLRSIVADSLLAL
jgi:hypothetical protein